MIAHAVRYMSVDSCRDPDSAGLRWTSPAADSLAREPENAQATGRFRRWWRMLGSNQRRLSRRFYRPNLAGSSRTADLVAAHDAILPPEFRDSSRQFPCFQFLNSVFPRHGDRLSLCASAWGRRPAGDRTPPELHRGIRWALYAKPKRHDGPGSLLADMPCTKQVRSLSATASGSPGRRPGPLPSAICPRPSALRICDR